MSEVTVLYMSSTPPEDDLNSYNMLQKKMKTVEKNKKSVSKSSSSNSTDLRCEEKRKEYTPEKETKRSSKVGKQDVLRNPDDPDRSFGDYFCPTCNSHMNSSDMWISHITGKRHKKNVRKGETDSKYEDLDEESNVKYELKDVNHEAIIGLEYINEIRRREPDLPPIYSCFLCQACVSTVPLLIDHVIGLKHRSNVLQENDPDEYKFLEAMNLSKGPLKSLIADKAQQYEEQHGRGEVKVKQEKLLTSYNSYKRNYDSEDDEQLEYKKSSKSKVSDKSSAVWRSIDAPKKSYRDESDNYREKSYKHDNRLEDGYRRNLSYRDKHSQDRQNEDYHRLSSRLSDDYLRSVSPRKYSYDQSPERDLPSRRLHDKFYPTEYTDARLYLEARSQDRVSQSSMSCALPHAEKSRIPSESTHDDLKKFESQLHSVSNIFFLKACVSRLEEWPALNLDKEELELFSKIHFLSEKIVKRSLPRHIQTMFKTEQRNPVNPTSETERRNTTVVHPFYQPSGPPSHQRQQHVGTSHMHEMFKSTANPKAETERSNRTMLHLTYQPSGHPSHQRQQHIGTSHAHMVDDINEFVCQSRKESEISAFNQQMSTFNPNKNICMSTSNASPSQLSPYTATPQPSNFVSSNFVPSAINFQSSANNFPPPANALPHPGNFTSKENNYTLSKKASPSLPTYRTRGNFESGIPGLSLTDTVTRQNKYSSYWCGLNTSREEPFQ